MPASIKNVLLINSLLIMSLIVLAYQLYVQWQSEHLLAYTCATLLGGLLLCQAMIIFRWQNLWRLVRALIYVLALLVGLFFMVSLADLFSLLGFVTCLSALLLMMYLIGLRGFLNSKAFLAYFTS